jgi:hypothetical protein
MQSDVYHEQLMTKACWCISQIVLRALRPGPVIFLEEIERAEGMGGSPIPKGEGHPKFCC